MKCDNGKISDIIDQIKRLYQELLEVKIQLEEKARILSLLTSKYTETNIKSINYKQEESITKIKVLIAQIESSVAAILAINEMDLTKEKKSSVLKPITTNQRFSFNFNTITEEETLNAIEKNFTKNHELTDIVNREISRQLKEFRK